MIKCFILVLAIGFWNGAVASATSVSKDSVKEFLLMVRFNSNAPTPDAETLKFIGMRWGKFISYLQGSGKLVAGFRPGAETLFISGRSKKISALSTQKEPITSIFIVKADNAQEAADLAKDCPILDLEGSVEVRAISYTAH